ncbi:MAG: type III pantothenate kinase [Kiritimatiellae bacterium]|nr:type III pantothenate kinase [Kiritimatiellia bacterium]MDW8459114.1 type III pantothenate kinase [Verrucomicrobiota bacterium]
MVVLVVDVGNTSTSAASYRGGRVSRVFRFSTPETSVRCIQRALHAVMGGRRPDGVAIASVVPRVDDIWRRALAIHRWAPVHFVTSRSVLDVPLVYPRPETIGADRIANAVGGVARYGKPLIVADFGTAVTFDIITRRGYEGGVIAPGLPLVFEYLAEKTAKLPRVRYAPVRAAWGRSTLQAMRLGAMWGYPGLVRGILEQLRAAPPLEGAKLVLTGGYARVVATSLGEEVRVDPTLTLFGIGRIFELNRERPA